MSRIVKVPRKRMLSVSPGGTRELEDLQLLLLGTFAFLGNAMPREAARENRRKAS